MLDRDQLEAFAAVVEHHSFDKAAFKLNITRGAISQRVKKLEEVLSTVLLVRERPIAPTAAGEIVLRHVKALRLLERDTCQKLSPDLYEPAPITIAVNADSLATWFGPLACFLPRQYPIALEIQVDDEDHTWPLLVRGEVTGCVSTERKSSHGFTAVPLGAMEYLCVATPVFAKKFFPDGFTLARALAAPAILFNRKDSLHDKYLEARFGLKVERYPKHYFPSSETLLDAIHAGIGYGLVPTLQIQTLLETGQLINLAPSHPVTVNLHWHHWETEPPIAKIITECIIHSAKTMLLQCSSGLAELGMENRNRKMLKAAPDDL